MDALTISNVTVTGPGSIDLGGNTTLSGTDLFEGTSPTPATPNFTNTGNITESSGGTVVTLDDETVNNTGGVFTVLPGDTLDLTNTNFYGGTLIVDPGATLNLYNAHITGVALQDAGAHVHTYGNSSINSVKKVIYGDITVYAQSSHRGVSTLRVDDSLLIATVTSLGTGATAGTVIVDSGHTSYFGDFRLDSPAAI